MPVSAALLALALAPGASAAGLPDNPSQYVAVDASTTPSAFFGGFDLEGDGYDDLLTVTSSGLLLYRGSAAGLSPFPRAYTSPTGTVTTVAALGDVNGDGVDDLLACDATASSGAGAAWLTLGSATSTSRRSALRYGATTTTAYGKACAGLGDVNGDGYRDYAVASTLSATRDALRIYAGGSAPGAVMLTLSRFGLVTPSASVYGGNGGSVEGIGDVNGDGYDDLAIGAVAAGRTDDRVLVYLGGPSGPIDPASVVIAAPWANGGGGGASSHFGYSISAGGDIDGDGYDDMIVTADAEAYLYGTLYVFWGSADGVHADDYSTAVGEYDSGAIAAWGGASFDGTPGNDVLTMGYGVFQAFTADGAGPAFLDAYWMGGTASTYEWPDYSTYAGDVNGDGCSDVIASVESWSATWTLTMYLGLFEGDCA